jgi:hypothetical protein
METRENGFSRQSADWLRMTDESSSAPSGHLPTVEEGSGLSVLVDAFQAARDEADRAEAEAKAAKKRLTEAKALLADAMIEDETDSIGRNGKRYTLAPKTKYSKKAGMEEVLFERLIDEGLGDLITETVNANTLNACMNRMAEENGGVLPGMWQEVLNTYEYTDISVRRV